ncbi:MAG: hypothetical protein CVV53_08400 [Spirochaetae bacterium HGW-Spirochaetae-9]|nr:MAG: hypothetical protein CVV53_08400 [Spirochaetae bacterium HGW-Spirochaetae-9]
MPGIKGRLSRLRERGLVKASELAAPSLRPPAPVRSERYAFLPGWERMAPHLYTRIVETGLSLDEENGGTFETTHFVNQRLRSKRGEGPAISMERPFSQLSFFDFETTGLSGGTGTIAFLAAIGFFDGRSFFIRQVFIDDFPGEAGFLALTVQLLAQRPELVTYNGAAFDLPLLRTRCIMNSLPVPAFGHIDLLHTSRRFWRKTLGSCSLQALEATVLCEGREGDVPGFLIPRLWLDYSASCPNPSEESLAAMERIAAHNLLDVRSLARLFLRIDRIMAEPERRWAAEKVYSRHLALELRAASRFKEAFYILEEAGSDGDQGALRLLARLYRREGRFEDYERVVESMDGRSCEGCIEKAKLYEHGKKNIEQAMWHTLRAIEILEGSRPELPAPLESRQALQQRQERLARKMEKLLRKG